MRLNEMKKPLALYLSRGYYEYTGEKHTLSKKNSLEWAEDILQFIDELSELTEGDVESLDTFTTVERLALEVFDNDAEKLIEWLNKPNPLFSNETPIEHVAGGNSQSVIDWLEETLKKMIDEPKESR